MADGDPYAEYEAASPELKKLIEKQLARTNAHDWFQDFLQFLSTAGGIGITAFIIYTTGNVIDGGNWASAVGGSVLGGSTVLGLARLYINANKQRAGAALTTGRPAAKKVVKGTPPAKKAVPAKKQASKRTPPLGEPRP